MARLSRENMLHVIRSGGSIILNGASYTMDNIDVLPTDADLAVQYGDKEEVKNVEASLDEQIEKLMAEKAKLAAAEKAKVEAAKVAENEKKSKTVKKETE